MVEDDQRIAEPVVAALRSQQHIVDVAADGRAGLEFSEMGEHDVVLLDLMLPDISGIEICKALRRRGSRAMVMMMTARDSVGDKVAALDLGADDYVVKPFDIAELLARIRALSRRGSDSAGSVLRHGRLEIDQASAQVRFADRTLDLTRTEYAILEALLRYPTRVFSAAALYDRATALDASGSPVTIKTHVANLRKKLQAAGCKGTVVMTVQGFGYRLADA